MTKSILSAIVFTVLFLSLQAQDVSFRLNNYKLDAKSFKLDKLIHGAEIGYTQHLNKVLDLYVPLRLGPRGEVETATNAIKKKTMQVGNFGMDIALQAKYDNGRFPIIPFVTAGLGTDLYDDGMAYGAPVGAGLNVRINSKTMITIANYYRFGMTKETPKGWMHSLGISVDLRKLQTKFTPPPMSKEQLYQERQLAAAKLQAEKEAAEHAKMEVEAEAKTLLEEIERAKANAEAIAEAEARAKANEERVPVVVSEEVKKVLDIALKGVQFETGSALLTKESYNALDDVATTMQTNTDLRISIEGHTDKIGNDAINLKLSEARAKTCYNYLISKGITSERLKDQGFGAARPVATNDTEEGRSQNRRVEFVPF